MVQKLSAKLQKPTALPGGFVFDSKVRRDSAAEAHLSSFQFVLCLWDCGALVKLLIPGSTATRKQLLETGVFA